MFRLGQNTQMLSSSVRLLLATMFFWPTSDETKTLLRRAGHSDPERDGSRVATRRCVPETRGLGHQFFTPGQEVRRDYLPLNVSEVKRLKYLEEESRQLKRLLEVTMREKAALEDAILNYLLYSSNYRCHPVS